MSNDLSSMRTYKSVDEADSLTDKSKKKVSKSRKIGFKYYLPWVLTVILLVFSFFLWQQYSQARNKLTSPSVSNNTQVANQLSKLIDLPTEKPLVLTVKSTANLKILPFFASAKPGDMVFLYPKTSEAILFRTSINKIINFSTNPTDIQSLDNFIFHS